MFGNLDKLVIALYFAWLEILACGQKEIQKDALPRLLRTHEEQDEQFSQKSLKSRQTTRIVWPHRAMEIDVEGSLIDHTILNMRASEPIDDEHRVPEKVYLKDRFVDVVKGDYDSHQERPAVQLKYEKFASKFNLCMSIADTSSVINSSLVLKPCVDGDKNFLFETPNYNTSGAIRWAGDLTKCLYNRNGWLGNGNEIVMHDCDDSGNSHDMTFFHLRLNESSSFWWTYNYTEVPSRLLEIEQNDKQFPDPDGLEKVVLWDSSCDATWLEVALQGDLRTDIEEDRQWEPGLSLGPS